MKRVWVFPMLSLLAFPVFSLVPERTEVAVSFAEASLAKVQKALKEYQKSFDKGKVVLFDSQEQTLFKNGMVLRLRAFKDSEELTMKVRGPAQFPSLEKWKNWDTKCEQDLSPYSGRISCSINQEIGLSVMKKILDGSISPNSIVPKEFWAFAEELRGNALSTMTLSTTEAADISIWKYKGVKNLGDKNTKVTLEVWTLPNNAVLSELSMKDQTKLAISRLTELTDWLKNIRVEAVDLTPSKSEQILQFLR